MTQSVKLSKSERKAAFAPITKKSDNIMNYVMLLYFAFGLFLASFYDTWTIAVGVGGLCVLAHFITKAILPGYSAYQYVMSGAFAIFSAQFIYQMHGLFEMHFMFFVGSALLITYRNWKLIIPLVLITVIHHTWFAWLQYSGTKEIYFTQLSYMDLHAFIFHVSLAAVIMGICAYWSYDLGKTTLSDATKNLILEKQVINVKKNIAFAEAITSGNLDMQFQADTNDELGQSLAKMRESLRITYAREEQEKFTNVGITKIGDIIRQYSTNPEVLADEFIKGLVKYVGLNQGGIFLHEVDEKKETLRLAACYAYERKRYITKELDIDESLVGQCFLEREPIYLTHLPNNYVKITSGLGDATPKCLFIVPIIANETIVGVIELASFNELKEYQKQFIRHAAENIASAILSTRTTHKIKMLLTDAEQRTEEMRAQEEEMRQNMEELQATQEEMARKQMDTENRMKAINESGIASIEFNLKGYILDANDAFLRLMGYRLDEIQGKHHRIFVDRETAESHEYERFWQDLGNGIAHPGQYKRVTKNGKEVFIQGCYSILRDHNERPVKVLKLAIDITNLSSLTSTAKNQESTAIAY